MRIEPRSSRKLAIAARALSCAALLAVVCAFVLSVAFAADQPSAGNSAKGFKTVLDFFPKPHETQMHSYLEGSESEMGPNGMVILHDAKLQTFREDGSREMVMNAPQCYYDYSRHFVNSTGSLRVQTWDDHNRALELQGSNGFYWQQTNSLLIVSNQQKTTISGALTNSFNP